MRGGRRGEGGIHHRKAIRRIAAHTFQPGWLCRVPLPGWRGLVYNTPTTTCQALTGQPGKRNVVAEVTP